MKLTKATLKRIIKEELSTIQETEIGYMDGPLSAYEDEGDLDPVALADELVTLAVKERIKDALKYSDDYYGDMGLQEMARAQRSVESWSSKPIDDHMPEDFYWLHFCEKELEGHPAHAKLAEFNPSRRGDY